MKKKVVVLTGAGISAESGIKTFRDSDGLWEGHDVMEVASPQGWAANPSMVQDFYNKRRAQLREVEPNVGHLILAELEKDFDLYIITQNVDDLHERAGSTKVLHLHGELLKARSIGNPDYLIDWVEDLDENAKDPDGHQLRPHIVWFGEEVPALYEAAQIASSADIFAVVGTSMQVYPAAGLIDYAPSSAKLFYVDPKPAQIPNLKHRLETIAEVASTGLAKLRERLLSGV